jgi:hypothetical protein
MPSIQHEALIEMFRNRPSLAAELLGGALGVDLPAYHVARLESGDLPDLTPTEYRADVVVVLANSETPVLAVVVEVQLGRDKGKRWSWPVYLATLRARLRCATVLLIVCTDTATATWCAAPIELGHPGWTLSPLVLGPERVPVVTDADEAARDPELAVLSAMTHGGRPDRTDVLRALVSALAAVDEELATLYSDLVLDALPAAAHRYWEALVTAGTFPREYRSPLVRRYVGQGRAEGRVQGEAAAVLTVLDARGIEVPADARARITSCTDLDQLDSWIRRAVTATSIDQLFDEPEA